MSTPSLHILDYFFRKCIFWCNGVMNIYTDCDFPHYTRKQSVCTIRPHGVVLLHYTNLVRILSVYGEA